MPFLYIGVMGISRLETTLATALSKLEDRTGQSLFAYDDLPGGETIPNGGADLHILMRDLNTSFGQIVVNQTEMEFLRNTLERLREGINRLSTSYPETGPDGDHLLREVDLLLGIAE